MAMRSESLCGTDVSAQPVSEVAETDSNANVRMPVSSGRRLRRVVYHGLIRLLTLLSQAAIVFAGWIGRKPRPIGPEGCEIMLTGRFDSDNWILAHIGPLSASNECSRLWMVSTNPVPELPKVTAIYPPRWLLFVMGPTLARLLVFVGTSIWKRPHIVGGFHLILNGITAVFVGRLIGARSMYFSVGGPTEVRDGGVHSDDNPFAKMETADAVVEKRLIWIAAHCDMIVTMGTKAVTYFQERGVQTEYHVVSGGIDSQRFCPSEEPPSIDIILTARLAQIKRIDVFLHAVKHASQRLPGIKAVIVGDGKLHEELRSLTHKLGIEDNVRFVGHQEKVEEWLRRAKVFALTSDSEGLSLAMMEAMMSGLPAVVSNVGDLGDLVSDGVNGYLVPRRSAEAFGVSFAELLSDEPRRATFSRAARSSALTYATEATIRRWDGIIKSSWRQ